MDCLANYSQNFRLSSFANFHLDNHTLTRTTFHLPHYTCIFSAARRRITKQATLNGSWQQIFNWTGVCVCICVFFKVSNVFNLYCIYMNSGSKYSNEINIIHAPKIIPLIMAYVCMPQCIWQPLFHNIIARRHGPMSWMALHNEGHWWMDTYNHEPVRATDHMYPYTNPRVV